MIFFASGFLEKLGISPEFAFVDGMHLFEYALRDVMHAEAAMHPGGIIATNDVCPYDHGMALRDPTPDDAPFAWTGDVGKTVVILKEVRPDLQVEVLTASSTGLCVLRGLDPENRTLFDGYDSAVEKFHDMTLEQFGVENYFNLVNPIDPERFLQSI